MSKERFTLPSAVFLLLEQGEEILLLRRANTGWHDGDYDLPAGHLDGNEASTTAAAREGLEELGVTIDPHRLVFTLLTHGISSDGKEYYNIYFRATEWTGTPRIMEPHKCDDLAHFHYDSLPLNLTPNTRRGLEAIRDGIQYLEYGFDES